MLGDFLNCIRVGGIHRLFEKRDILFLELASEADDDIRGEAAAPATMELRRKSLRFVPDIGLTSRSIGDCCDRNLQAAGVLL